MLEDMPGEVIRVSIVKLAKTGMLMAVSDSIKGIVVHGRSVKDVDRRIEGAIRHFFEERGGKDVEVEMIGKDAALSRDKRMPASRNYLLKFRRVATIH
jgi:hypothetical protein